MAMKLLVLALFAALLLASAALQPGDSISPYEVLNTKTGDEYCQVCVYGAKEGKIVAFGKIGDADFWADLKKLQVWAEKYPKLGIFAQVIDSKDAKAIQVEAAKQGVKFPVVVAVAADWDEAYQVKGVSRTTYYAKKNNKIAWTGVGLESTAEKALAEKIAVDLAS